MLSSASTSRTAAITATVLLSSLWSCSSTSKPPAVNTVLVDEMEAAEWRCWPGTKAVDVLGLAAGALGDASSEVRLRAAGLLGRKAPPGADRALLDRRELEGDPLVRREIVSALGRLDTETSRGALLRMASSEEAGEESALALANIGSRKEDHAALGAALASPVPGRRLAAALSLTRYPAAAQASRVAAALAVEKDERVRWVLAEALRLCGGGEWSGHFCSLILDENFLVSMAASRAAGATLQDEPCFDEVLELAAAPGAPWLARLGAAQAVSSWLEGAGEGGKVIGRERGNRLEKLVVEKAAEVLSGRISRSALRREWLRCLFLCRGRPARELVEKLRGQPGWILPAAGRGAGAAELLGGGARSLDAIPAAAPVDTMPPFRPYSSFRLARLRPPRLCLLAKGGEKIYLELFLSSAPNHASAVLHLVERGAFAGLRPRRLVEPVGLLIDPVVEDADPAAGCALAPELSSRRILRGTVISHPLHGGGGRLFIAGRPLPEWEGRVTVLGRILLGQRELAGLGEDTELDLVRP
ncbi:MAG: HEAT repeat domain-containing protein [Planctomycetes bacterium]|nr:HEAT repeat domain-containing protein [Planctomycetota bacterium]